MAVGAAQAFPSVDILINNVGRFLPHEFTQSTDQDWYQTFDLNVMSGVRLSRLYLPGMKQRNWVASFSSPARVRCRFRWRAWRTALRCGSMAVS
jgi:NADP-dependent 3-hydroxy acid dehydrogenase YdfG